MGFAQSGIYQGLGRGIANAGQSVLQALYMAKQQKLQEQQLGMEQQAQNRANQQQQDTETLQGFVSPGQVQPLPQSSPQDTDQPTDTAGALSPVGNLTAGGQGNPFAASQGQTSGGKPLPSTGKQGAMPVAGLFDVLQRASQMTTGTQAGGVNRPNQSQPGPTTTAAQTGQLGGYDTSRYVPASWGRFLDLQGPQFQQNMALMRAMQQAELARGIALKQVPDAVNPDELDLRNRQLAQTTANEAGQLKAKNREIDVNAGLRNAMLGITMDKTGEGFANTFAGRTKDDRKAGELAQQLQDAYGQATGATTPDGKPNPGALKSLIVNQIANTEPGMQVRLGTLRFNGLGGDISLAGKLATNIDVALHGLPPEQQIAQMHQVAQQMIATKAQRYAQEYQAESQAHPEIPNYESNYLRPTLHPSVVFGSSAQGTSDWKTLLPQAEASIAARPDLANQIKARYKVKTGRDFDGDISPAAKQ